MAFLSSELLQREKRDHVAQISSTAQLRVLKAILGTACIIFLPLKTTACLHLVWQHL